MKKRKQKIRSKDKVKLSRPSKKVVKKELKRKKSKDMCISSS